LKKLKKFDIDLHLQRLEEEVKESETREKIEFELYQDELKEQGIVNAWKSNLEGFA